MMEIDVLNKDREIVESLPVNEEIFNKDVKTHLMHQAVVMQLNNSRSGTAAAKTRSMIAGSGVKPWRQKGTGRARSGTASSPLWRKGGVAFGPQPKEYKHKMTKKASRLAILHTIISKWQEKNINIIDDIIISNPKTKEVIEFILKLEIETDSGLMIVIDKENKNLELGIRNISNIGLLNADYINVYDLLLYKNLLFTKEAFLKVKERFSL